MRLSTMIVLASTAPALAVVNPYTETFDSSASNWSSSSVLTSLNYFPSGGPECGA